MRRQISRSDLEAAAPVRQRIEEKYGPRRGSDDVGYPPEAEDDHDHEDDGTRTVTQDAMDHGANPYVLNVHGIYPKLEAFRRMQATAEATGHDSDDDKSVMTAVRVGEDGKPLVDHSQHRGGDENRAAPSPPVKSILERQKEYYAEHNRHRCFGECNEMYAGPDGRLAGWRTWTTPFTMYIGFPFPKSNAEANEWGWGDTAPRRPFRTNMDIFRELVPRLFRQPPGPVAVTVAEAVGLARRLGFGEPTAADVAAAEAAAEEARRVRLEAERRARI